MRNRFPIAVPLGFDCHSTKSFTTAGLTPVDDYAFSVPLYGVLRFSPHNSQLTECPPFLGKLSFQDKNSALGCGYDITLTSPDYDPAQHYWNLYAGCRLSNGLGVVIILTCLLATYAVMDIDMEKRRSQAGSMESPLI